MYYAQLNDNNICVNLISTPNIISAKNMILISSIIDSSLLGKKYNYETQQWEDNPELIQENFIKLKNKKINELNNICNQTIIEGLDIKLSNNEIKHFSFKEEDQINLTTAYNSVKSGITNFFPYHSDNELCEYYSSEDIITIAETLLQHKTYHITYYNSLKNWINSLTEKDEEIVKSIYYGIEIPEDKQSQVLKDLLKQD